MALLSLRDVRLAFGGPLLLDGVSAQFERGERIGLVGRNGEGKSTLLRILRGDLAPDGGEVIRQQGLTIRHLRQDVPEGRNGTVFDEVADGGHSDAAHRVDEMLSRMALDPDAPFAALSAGMKRRVLLAKALLDDPDVLLLDEPTNHLDIRSIRWLEDFLARFAGTLIFVTHDRVFLQKLATRILELDRGRLFDWSCDYSTFLERKEAALAAEEQQQALFDKRLAQEEVWIRKGIQARRTRNEGRVRALKAMREERTKRRERIGTAKVQIQEADRSGALVIEAKSVGFAYGDSPVISELTTTIMRGDKVGIIGPNGAGKTTLLRLLLGRLTPSSGTVKHGTNLEIAYFDQLRASLDEDKTVQENVGEGYDSIVVNGQSRHVIGYLQDFLFPPERSRCPVRILSGGERNRLLLAKLFTKPSNVLVLDEPTNDLDVETLELLESLCVDYPGTILLVSHDRAFLNDVVTSTLVIDPEGVVKEYDGGYDDALRQNAFEPKEPPKPSPVSTTKIEPSRPSVPKLSFKDRQELERLPKQIEEWEAQQASIHATMADPAFYSRDREAIAREAAALEEIETKLQQAYARWEELESLANPAY
jgi:ATP-binding cassette subfamily F protein uup